VNKPGKLIIISISVAIFIVLTGLIWLFKSPSSLKIASSTQQTIQVENGPLKENLSNIVKTYRKIIVLLENDASLDAQQLEAASIIGRILFHENQQRLNDLIKQLNGELERASTADFGIVSSDVEQFLNTLEDLAEWHDADKLVFRDSVDQMAESLRGLPGSQKPKMDLQDRLENDRKALLEIQALYEKELEKIFGRFETRGMMVRREAWEQYVAYLKTKFKRDDILKEYSHLLPSPAKEGDKKTQKQSFSRGMTGTHLPPKTLVLTFDDGPHPSYTDRIIDILKKYQVKAVFFEVGQNLGSFKKDNTIQHTRAAAASERAIKSGFSLGNHSHTHPFLPKLADKELLDEIERPNQLLQAVTQTPIILFRPPYGAQNEKLLAALQDHHLKSILWNIDSRDWADPIPKSIANRVLGEVFKQDHGIILFHDIHQRTIEALPLVLETLKNDGYHFLT
jgi:peptidoglycan/xylan/chitin deacetylase (PgdA/CDA1 family)